MVPRKVRLAPREPSSSLEKAVGQAAEVGAEGKNERIQSSALESCAQGTQDKGGRKPPQATTVAYQTLPGNLGSLVQG